MHETQFFEKRQNTRIQEEDIYMTTAKAVLVQVEHLVSRHERGRHHTATLNQSLSEEEAPEEELSSGSRDLPLPLTTLGFLGGVQAEIG